MSICQCLDQLKQKIQETLWNWDQSRNFETHLSFQSPNRPWKSTNKNLKNTIDANSCLRFQSNQSSILFSLQSLQEYAVIWSTWSCKKKKRELWLILDSNTIGKWEFKRRQPLKYDDLQLTYLKLERVIMKVSVYQGNEETFFLFRN